MKIIISQNDEYDVTYKGKTIKGAKMSVKSKIAEFEVNENDTIVLRFKKE